MNSITNLSVQQLRQAASLKEQIQSLENQLSKILGSSETKLKSAPQKTGRRKMSAAGRAKMSAAAKLRWKKVKEAGKKKL